MNKPTQTERLKRVPKQFRRLTGLTPEKFDEILIQIKPLYDIWNEKRLNRKERKRKIGGGMKHGLPLEDRFLMLLIYARTYTTHIFLGFLFGIDDSNVSRNINPLHPLLAQIFRIPERKIQITNDEVTELFFDGTEQPTNRPGPGKHQKNWYSGKKKKHTIKHQLVVAKKNSISGEKRRTRIVAVSKTFPGKTHDKTIYDESRMIKPPDILGTADSGYQGTTLNIPTKKPKGGKLTKKQRKTNRALSRKRVVVENSIWQMKIWRIVRDQFRGKRRNHCLIFKNIAGLHNLMFA